MERHYIVLSTFAFSVIGMIAIYSMISCFKNYIEQIRSTNPARAALVSLLFCASWWFVCVGVRTYFPAEERVLSLINIIREVALAGIVFMGIFTLLFCVIYVVYAVRPKFDKPTKENCNEA